MQALARTAYDWLVNSRGSSRTSALIRVAMATVAVVRWGEDLLLYKDTSAIGLALSVGFFASVGCMFAGWYSRLSSLLLGLITLSMYYYFGMRLGRPDWVYHHTYLHAFTTTLVSLTPCGASYSVDRWLAVRRAQRSGHAPPAESGNLLGLRLLSLQVGAVYFFTAYQKTFPGFLRGDRLEHYAMHHYLGSNYPHDSWLFPALMAAIAVATVVLEYALAIGLFFRRTRRYLMPAGIALHVGFYVLLPIRTFSATMMILYLAFLDPDRVHAAIDTLSGHTPPAPTDTSNSAATAGPATAR